MVVPPGVKAQGTLVGTFRWQLLPYCNVITVTAVQLGAHYDIDGIDDQFGAPRAASVVGGAFINPDGSIGLGFTTVTSPGGAALHADATISLAILSGTCWHDNGVAASWEAADNYCYDQFRAGACTLAQWRSAVCRAGVATPGRLVDAR